MKWEAKHQHYVLHNACALSVYPSHIDGSSISGMPIAGTEHVSSSLFMDVLLTSAGGAEGAAARLLATPTGPLGLFFDTCDDGWPRDVLVVVELPARTDLSGGGLLM
jgi:hypothetical protein